MRVDELNANFDNRVPFRHSESSRVPERAGCYVLSSIYGDALYVGQSVNLHRRMEQHLADDRMTSLTTPLGLASWFCWQLADDSELRPLETQLLFRFKAAEGELPPLNRVGP